MEHKLDPEIYEVVKLYKKKRNKYSWVLVVVIALALVLLYYLPDFDTLFLPLFSFGVAAAAAILISKLYPLHYQRKAYKFIGEKVGWKIFEKDVFLKVEKDLLIEGNTVGQFSEIIKKYFNERNLYVYQFIIWGKNMPIEFIYLSAFRGEGQSLEQKGIFFFPLRVQLKEGEEVFVSNRPSKILPLKFIKYGKYEMESNDFNKKFIVSGSDSVLTYQVLHPSIMATFLDIDFWARFIIKDKFLILETKINPLVDEFLTIIKECYSLIDHINDAFAKDLPEGDLVKQLRF